MVNWFDSRVVRVVGLALAAVVGLILAIDLITAGGVDGLLADPLKLGLATVLLVVVAVLEVTTDSAFEE